MGESTGTEKVGEQSAYVHRKGQKRGKEGPKRGCPEASSTFGLYSAGPEWAKGVDVQLWEEGLAAYDLMHLPLGLS